MMRETLPNVNIGDPSHDKNLLIRSQIDYKNSKIFSQVFLIVVRKKHFVGCTIG